VTCGLHEVTRLIPNFSSNQRHIKAIYYIRVVHIESHIFSNYHWISEYVQHITFVYFLCVLKYSLPDCVFNLKLLSISHLNSYSPQSLTRTPLTLEIFHQTYEHLIPQTQFMYGIAPHHHEKVIKPGLSATGNKRWQAHSMLKVESV
jgi:hypothetical protein